MSFVAKYKGVCCECEGDILPGQRATFDNEAVGKNPIRHFPYCPDDYLDDLDDPLPKARTDEVLCPRCYLIHRPGACAYDE